jgi:hypothetical protein
MKAYVNITLGGIATIIPVTIFYAVYSTFENTVNVSLTLILGWLIFFVIMYSLDNIIQEKQ